MDKAIQTINELSAKQHGFKVKHAAQKERQTMDKLIKVEKKRVYGNDLIYVKSEHEAALVVLTGKITIDEKDINALKELGFDFEVIAPEL